MTRLVPALLVGLAAWFVMPRGLGLIGGAPRTTAAPAALLTVGLVAPTGPGAALATLPWCALVVVTAVRVGRPHLRARDRFEAVVAIASLTFLVVGAVWATVAAAGADPVHVSDVIVILTAAHFHYAGFAFGAIAARTRRDRPGAPVDVPIVLWLVGVPAVAVTIATHSTNPLGAIVLSAAGAGTGTALAGSALRHHSRGLAVAGASIVAGVALATGYALALRFGFPWLDIAAMQRTHGILNAIGFAVVGVAAWTAVDRRARAAAIGEPCTSR